MGFPRQKRAPVDFSDGFSAVPSTSHGCITTRRGHGVKKKGPGPFFVAYNNYKPWLLVTGTMEFL